MKKLAVVAFGGNALLRGDQVGTIEEQEQNALDTCERLIKLIDRGYNVALTHGNGPQVGNILLANAAGNQVYNLPEMPLDICVAYSQGFIGYMLEQQMRNVLRAHDMDRDVITIITQVLVDRDDPAFENPTKPIGPYYTRKMLTV
jgi:carbamate kinase